MNASAVSKLAYTRIVETRIWLSPSQLAYAAYVNAGTHYSE
jgi:hypothetical protein